MYFKIKNTQINFFPWDVLVCGSFSNQEQDMLAVDFQEAACDEHLREEEC